MGDNQKVLDDAVDTAIELASSYLRGRYDVDVIFYPIDQYADADASAYLTGKVIKSNKDLIYTVLKDAPGTDITLVTDYQPGDPRNKVLVQVIIDIAIYNTFSTISPNNIQSLRVKRHDDAMRWLGRVQKEEISPDLPIITDSTSQTYTFSAANKTAERW